MIQDKFFALLLILSVFVFFSLYVYETQKTEACEEAVEKYLEHKWTNKPLANEWLKKSNQFCDTE